MVFISYSKRDKKYYQEFERHLKPLKDLKLLNVWRDRDNIKVGQDWHNEIQKAIINCDIAILFISPDFLATEYIIQNEISLFLQAREERQLEIACLYLTSSLVQERTFCIELPRGEIRKRKLTDYQGLTAIENFISEQKKSQREAIYAQAALKIKELIINKNQFDKQFKPDRRVELTVQLKFFGGLLTRSYYHNNDKITQFRSNWKRSENLHSNAFLVETLFGSESNLEHILRLLSHAFTNPVLYPIRLRIQTDNQQLSELPWAETTWRNRTLRDYGWTFELTDAKKISTALSTINITMKLPCQILAILPKHIYDHELHHREIEECISYAWTFYGGEFQHVSDWLSLTQVLETLKPNIVYYYGTMEKTENDLFLVLDDEKGNSERHSIMAIDQIWQDFPPQIFFCNFVANYLSASTILSKLHPSLILTQTSVDVNQARDDALSWLHDILEFTQDVDPVWLMHKHMPITAKAWSTYEAWHKQVSNQPTKEQLVRLQLGRRNQLGSGRDEILQLATTPQRRLCCILAYGEEGNLAEFFAQQLYEYQRCNPDDSVQILRIPMRLPSDSYFNEKELEIETRRQFRISDTDPFQKALANRSYALFRRHPNMPEYS